MKTKPEIPLRPQIVVSKVLLNAEVEYELDQDTDWVGELLDELSENVSEFTIKILKPKTFLTLDLVISKKSKPQMGEFLLVQGHLETSYATECVKSLKPMIEHLEIDFNSCFLSEDLNQKDQYAEIDEIFEGDDVYQIYYYQKNLADLKEMIHEVIFLHYNQYPMIDTQLEKID